MVSPARDEAKAKAHRAEPYAAHQTDPAPIEDEPGGWDVLIPDSPHSDFRPTLRDAIDAARKEAT